MFCDASSVKLNLKALNEHLMDEEDPLACAISSLMTVMLLFNDSLNDDPNLDPSEIVGYMEALDKQARICGPALGFDASALLLNAFYNFSGFLKAKSGEAAEVNDYLVLAVCGLAADELNVADTES